MHIASAGDIKIGGNHPVVVQSMTNTPTLDTLSTVNQAESLVNAGCQMVRIAVQNIAEAKNLKNIKKLLLQRGIKVPLVADVHFKPEVAEIAAAIVEKVRINPGNYIIGKNDSDEVLEKAAEKLYPLIKICKENGTAIRVGTNHGSLSQRILYKYGNTPQGMVFSALGFVELLRKSGFDNIVVSVKSSDVFTMIKANMLLAAEMEKRGYYYPVHLGVTEAGAGQTARIKSAAGIGSLLASGIGDTIRVSLTESPVEEIPFAKKIRDMFPKGAKYSSKPQFFTAVNKNLVTHKPFVISNKPVRNTDFWYKENDTISGKAGESAIRKSKHISANGILKLKYNLPDFDTFLIKSAVDTTLIAAKDKIAGLWLDNGSKSNDEECAAVALDILQALKLRFSKTEFIACPSCGRTRFDIMKQLKDIEKALPVLENVKIAVMGCIVNGLGEMADADYGFVGSGEGKVTIFKGKEAVYKNIPENEATGKLVELIKKHEKIRH